MIFTILSKFDNLFKKRIWKKVTKEGGEDLFKITESASKILRQAIRKESKDGEKLYVRLTMGIG
jgi:hypothetical protein